MTVPITLTNGTVADADDVMSNFNYFERRVDLQRGFIANGKLSITDSGSGLVVAVKTFAGSDPSTSSPVYIRIGDSIRTITSALSRTLADGTNWFNAGGTELATKEVDYFAYLIWDSNSSAVGLGFARIPYANLVSDFSATTTNEKYIAGYADFTTTDEVEVVGRFAATLSAGAGYTWTVPTFTASNLIQRPIYETRWLTWLPTYAGYTGAVTTTLATYKLNMNTVFTKLTFTGTSNATTLTTTAPFTSSATGYYEMLAVLVTDNTVIQSYPGRMNLPPSSATIAYGKLFNADGAFTNSGTKSITGSNYRYEI